MAAACFTAEVLVVDAMQSDNRAFATADDDDDDDEPAPPPKQAVPTRPSAAAAGRGVGRAGPGAAAGKGPKDAAARQAEFRAKKLLEEAEVRQLVLTVDACAIGLQNSIPGGRQCLSCACVGPCVLELKCSSTPAAALVRC
jgi:hypothetical protein